MADDGSEKKPDPPETAIELRGHIGQLEGNHDVLPVVVVPATVDLSRVDTSIVAHITSFVGKSRELLNLALTCKSFGWPQPASSLNLSLVEEVACGAVCSRATDAEMSSLPAYTSGTTTWLSILNRFEHLLDFDLFLGFGYIKHMNGVRSAVCAIGSAEWGDHDVDAVDDICYWDYCTAVASGYVMTSGVHCAQFNIVVMPRIGIVRPMPGLDADRYLEEEAFEFDRYCSHYYPDFLAQRSDDWGGSNIHACEYDLSMETLTWTDWGEEEGSIRGERIRLHTRSEDMGSISIVLNLDEGTMAVHDCAYADHKVLLKDGLSGPYCWYVNLTQFETVAIKRGTYQT
ncbi:hypothetical protein THAOC_23995 [Thalassiosira oceanica]|uniref:Uncharacterized protein n=1 Tax=Thalassiosira oceanica TaxID=159749 RepID=K0S5L6_THAOC|nr:hypothetical protein THAOC_23995 [Thalassiosira oceanica]|eukprot:EJK56171.1 hypothetical protein THAOC_23995 [Thalassiosira oceanica]